MTDDFDSPWKDVLERYFPDFMAFFFPEAHTDIDWSRGYESLDSELQQVVRDAETGRRLADKLMEVHRRDGQAQIVRVHIEVQGGYDAAFAERMFVYHYRLYDRYRQPIVSLAVLGDDSPSWRPTAYQTELWGCGTRMWFPMVKLADYSEHSSALEASDNPFAVMVMAHLQTRATRQDPEARLGWKLRLVKRLYEKGYNREDVLELFRFIDWLLALPAALEQRFRDQLADYEAAMSTPYITSIERSGIEKGRQQGIRQGLAAERTLLQRQVERRFGETAAARLARLLETIDDTDRLAEIGEWVVDCTSSEELLARVEALGK
jgi:hypothetical protein